jgi:hypothetical protein
MGLINREMASREGQNLEDPFWGNLSDWKCFGEPWRPLLVEPFGLEVFWQNLLDHLKHNKCISRILEL